jgi:hypothetical protein
MARAEMRIEEVNGVWGFTLIINGNKYGHYPFNGVDDKAIAQQIISMSIDAADYGSSEISFSLLKTTLTTTEMVEDLEATMSK